jgi:hypothetical protein
VLPWGVGYEVARGFYYKPEAERVREAFRQFLAGNHSYGQLSKLVGVTPRGMHLIMRNPIWIGWRVIDKKRDASSAGRYASINGRQADRRKIARAPEDVIRVKVIADPLLSARDFQEVQRIMDLKQAKHWRAQPNIVHRFTYSGFLTCSQCGELIHSALARRDYYACKGRRTNHLCKTRYMAREKLEKRLDSLFADQLTDPDFIERCISDLRQRCAQDDSVVRVQRLSAELSGLHEKRSRVVETFLDGVFGREERDSRLAKLDRDIQLAQNTLLRCSSPAADVDAKRIVEAFAPLVEWEYWSREQKRSVLAAIVPEIRVADYQVAGLGLNRTIFSTEDTRRDRDSSQPPA